MGEQPQNLAEQYLTLQEQNTWEPDCQNTSIFEQNAQRIRKQRESLEIEISLLEQSSVSDYFKDFLISAVSMRKGRPWPSKQSYLHHAKVDLGIDPIKWDMGILEPYRDRFDDQERLKRIFEFEREFFIRSRQYFQEDKKNKIQVRFKNWRDWEEYLGYQDPLCQWPRKI